MLWSSTEVSFVFLKFVFLSFYLRKPQYSLASEVPLNLFHCKYPLDDSLWLVDEETLGEVESNLQRLWTFSSVKYEFCLLTVFIEI